MQKIDISQFFKNQYTEYALYTVRHRAIPGLDGLKPSARKVLHAAHATLSVGKPQKMLNLVGATFKESSYHHGDASLNGVIIGLGSHYENNSAPLTIIGAGGTLRAPDSAAPRYLSVMLNRQSDIYFTDIELVDYNYDGEERIEPVTYLPIIPLMLANRNSGMALGYAYSNLMSFSLSSLADSVLAALSGKSIEEIEACLTPEVKEFYGKWSFSEGRWKSSADYSYDLSKGELTVIDLPIDQTYGSYEAAIVKLLTSGFVKKFENLSDENQIKYRVTCNPEDLTKVVTRGLHEKIFKLSCWINRPNLTCISPKGKVLEFKRYGELIQYFVKWRSSYYPKRKALQIKKLNEKIVENDQLLRFIEAVLTDKLILNKRAIVDVRADMKAMKLDEGLLRTAVSKLTKEEYEAIQKRQIELAAELTRLEALKPEDMYVSDLKNLQN